MGEKQDWAARHADHLRRVLIHEPRGHADMFGAVLTEPASPGAHAGVLFMQDDGFTPVSAQRDRRRRDDCARARIDRAGR